MSSLIKVILSIIFLLHSLPGIAEESISVNLDDDTELQTLVYPANGDSIVVILPSGHGITEGLQSLADSLSNKGIETWIADPFSTWFLPTVETSLKEIPVSAYAKLFSKAEQTGKKLYLVGNDKAAALLLESAHEWQSTSTGMMSGVILVSPDLYQMTPAPGSEGEFLPVVKATNLPIYMLVAEKSTLALRIRENVMALQESGSDVFTQVIPEVRNRFFFRPDATDVEKQAASDLASKIIRAMELVSFNIKDRKPGKLKASTHRELKKITGRLRKTSNDFQANHFELEDIKGKKHSLSQYRGNVLIVNFWASWCPPCIHEIPSMSKLYKDMSGRPFTILAINLGEKQEDVREFLQDFPVDFPVLLDPQQTQPKQWKVFAFPTSFLLDKKGVVRYSVAGGIDWSEKEVTDVIESLLNEK
ncbi:redoxin domain-containing protein [Kaarinaea lacus]